ncbi:MAG: AmmeMemoRadiSam system protein B, partial [Candidatus Eisenbacteria bacterium]|nr:AmmeMemoRadiSam system protein B [Candidatus Eisenbacteria bacterium]
MNALPRLRPLELLQIPNEGMLLRDPEGFSEEELVLSEPAVFIAAHFDGEHTLEDAQKAFGERYGRMPTESEVRALWDQLSEAFFLENDAFVARKQSRIESFLGTAERAPAHEGVAYPKDPEEAKKTVTRFFEEANSLEQSGEIPSGSLAGLVAPHIDLRHGGPCTALAYRYLAEATHINTVVVLGTSHACPEPAWIVSDKPFQTPLGTVPIDEEAVNYLRSSAPSTKEQLYLHRHEHSIEFQAVFLAALRSLGRSISMVPVL